MKLLTTRSVDYPEYHTVPGFFFPLCTQQTKCHLVPPYCREDRHLYTRHLQHSTTHTKTILIDEPHYRQEEKYAIFDSWLHCPFKAYFTHTTIVNV